MTKFFIKANDVEFGTIEYVCNSYEEMQRVWNELGDDVQMVQVSNNGVRQLLFERCW